MIIQNIRKHQWIHRGLGSMFFIWIAFVNPQKSDVEMVFVEGGTFMMGATPEQGTDAEDNEKLVHQVTLKNFYIGKYEVTIEQFKEFITSSGYKTDAETGAGDWKGSYIWKNGKWKSEKNVNWECDEFGIKRKPDETNYPVLHMSWNDACAFAKWKSDQTGQVYRLPTEAEWEFAARGGNKSKHYKYSGSNQPDEVAWFKKTVPKIYPTGLKAPNELGIYDMSGNAWEWCDDLYLDYESNIQKDSTYRSARGGSGFNPAISSRVSNRGFDIYQDRGSHYGFRIARNEK